jgi:plasmid stability protein
VKNFHLPLPENTYKRLRVEAGTETNPATALAREAIDSWLRDQARKARHEAIAAYAVEMAGTELDIDRELEAAGIEHLTRVDQTTK